jgi:nucleoside-diphosphate-sugar epimerase
MSAMRVLFIGGTGNLSMAATRLAVESGLELSILTRGSKAAELPPGVRSVIGDASYREALGKLVAHESFDAVVNWIAFTPEDVARDVAVFQGRVGQYVFISSASVYQKPPGSHVITESTPLGNPFWDYSRQKIAAEQALLRAHSERRFPVTIVRPSYSYGDTWIPTATGVDYTPVHRLRRGLELVVPGDGTSLWTMTHNSDLALGIVGLIGNAKAVGEAFHITSDEVLSWDQIYATIAAAVGAPPRLVHIPSDFIAKVDARRGASLLGDKAYSTVFDNSKIKQAVPEFAARVPFAEGIRRSVAWFDADPARQRIEANTSIEKILTVWRAAMSAAGFSS